MSESSSARRLLGRNSSTVDEDPAVISTALCLDFCLMLMRCDISRYHSDLIFGDKTASLASSALRQLSSMEPVSRHKALRGACRRAPLVVVKEVRLPALPRGSVAEGLLLRSLALGDSPRDTPSRAAAANKALSPALEIVQTPPLRLVHLVRDARAVLESRMHTEGFCAKERVLECLTELCRTYSSMLDWVERVSWTAAHSSGQQGPNATGAVMRMRSEDVALDPIGSLRRLYAFALGAAPDKDTETWLWNATHKKTAEAESYNLKRNGSEVVLRWRTHLSQQETALANYMCSSVLDRLGYRMGGKLTHGPPLTSGE